MTSSLKSPEIHTNHCGVGLESDEFTGRIRKVRLCGPVLNHTIRPRTKATIGTRTLYKALNRKAARIISRTVKLRHMTKTFSLEVTTMFNESKCS